MINHKTSLLLLLITFSSNAMAEPTAKVTLKVVDEKGIPVEGAKAGVGFFMPLEPGRGAGTKTSGERGLTDGDGLFTASGETQQLLGYSVKKVGYYDTSGRYLGLKEISGVMGFRLWEPWDPTIEVVLKKVINPVPLYVHRMELLRSKDLHEIPELDRFVGYDLTARDWVVPHGQGTHRDFLFKLEKHSVSSVFAHHVTLTLQFPNEGDGIQSYYDVRNEGSRLRLPYNAPTAGYESELIINRHRTATKLLNKKVREDQNYFFRVRTKIDDKGNVTDALYGKIHGAIKLGAYIGKFPTGTIKFDYYLNPNTNDTNLEFDVKRNLFKNLSKQEKVFEP